MSLRYTREKSHVAVSHSHGFVARLKTFSGHWCIWELGGCWFAARHSSKPGSICLTRKAPVYGYPNFALSKIFSDIDSSGLESACDSKRGGRKVHDQDSYQDILPVLSLTRNPVKRALRSLLSQGSFRLAPPLRRKLCSQTGFRRQAWREQSRSKMQSAVVIYF